jgi:hypothetical protein
MATQPTGRVEDPVSSPQHYVPPSLRDLRAHAVQRLQVGLFGLAAMLLLVGLANIIMDRARSVEQSAGTTDTATKQAEPKSDPLADIGVIPSPIPEKQGEQAPAGKAN